MLGTAASAMAPNYIKTNQNGFVCKASMWTGLRVGWASMLAYLRTNSGSKLGREIFGKPIPHLQNDQHVVGSFGLKRGWGYPPPPLPATDPCARSYQLLGKGPGTGAKERGGGGEWASAPPTPRPHSL